MGDGSVDITERAPVSLVSRASTSWRRWRGSGRCVAARSGAWS